jgi:tRNA A37 threonylcarbamoyladenosine dehydratase
MAHAFSRTERLVGSEALDILKTSRVAVFGIGGVGGYTVEALARSGVGSFLLVDNDTVSLTNLNRQIIATTETLGKDKVDVMKERIVSINPDAQVEIRKCFYLPETADSFDLSGYDYIVDAVDTVTAKIDLIVRADQLGVPVISAMGAGNKLDPTRFEVTDIYKTSVCPLAKVMRRELKKRHIKKCKVVYSKEQPVKPVTDIDEQSSKKSIPGSISFVPSVAGLIIAGEVVKDLIKR